MSGIEKLLNLLDKDIPECKKRLLDSHANLEDVATYCEGNYVRALDKKQALEETKSYMTQSLASVAYQINLMSVSFLQLLDLEVEQVTEMESCISHLSQVISIHKEKVARREIGELTSSKSYFRTPGTKSNGVLMPEKPEPPITYVRKPVDFNSLDYLGTSKKFSSKSDHLTDVQRHFSLANPSSTISITNAASTHSSTLKNGTPTQQFEFVSSVQSSLPPPPDEIVEDFSAHLPPPPSPPIASLALDDKMSPKLLRSPLSIVTTDDVAEPFAKRISRMMLDEASWIPPDYIEKVVAVYSYIQDKSDELSFDEGAIIYVTEKNEDGWWEGMMNGQTGLFPSNYVEPCI